MMRDRNLAFGEHGRRMLADAVDPHEKRGREKRHPKLIGKNYLPVRVSKWEQCIAEGDWECLEITGGYLGKPLVIEAVS